MGFYLQSVCFLFLSPSCSGSSLRCSPDSHALLHLRCDWHAGIWSRAAADFVFRNCSNAELDFRVTGVWEDRHGGRDENQPQQQLPDLPAGRPLALQVSCCVFGMFSSFPLLKHQCA